MSDATGIEKRPTGIRGVDDATHGGFPAKGTTLISGRAGSGKTVLAMEISARAAQRGEAVVFVSFEESASQLQANAHSFAWGPQLESDHVTILDARPHVDSSAAGSFDLAGLRAVLEDSVTRDNVSWVVLDGIDQILELEPNDVLAFDQIRALDEWSRRRRVTVLLTAKRSKANLADTPYLRTIEFMLSTVIDLSSVIVERRLNRRFRILKYRGSPHVTDELPMILDDQGVHLPFEAPSGSVATGAPTDRIGTGIPALDQILGGGVYRGSTTLLSGAPGTSKTTLAAAFVEAAAERGETSIFLSFDESAPRIVRNVASVDIDLQRHIDAGRIHMRSHAAWADLVEQHFMSIERMVAELRPHVLVIDPISALLKAGGAQSAYLAIERILGLTRAQDVTVLLTSLGAADDPSGEATLSHTSTLADTWITLDYRVAAGERNRALSIVKSRGTAHSNQVRELLLSHEGVDLADVYRYGTEVLLGTARIHAEGQEAERKRLEERERERRIRELENTLREVQRRAEIAAHEAQQLEQAIEDEREAFDARRDAAARHDSDIAKMRRHGRDAVSGAAAQTPSEGTAD